MNGLIILWQWAIGFADSVRLFGAVLVVEACETLRWLTRY